MIKINLGNNFIDNSEINKIYDIISEKVYDDICRVIGNGLEFNLNDKAEVLTSKEDVKKFLLSKNFYKYRFKNEENAIVIDFNKISSNTKINSILNDSVTGRWNEFKEKYSHQEEYKEILRILKELPESNNLGKLNKDVKNKVLEQLGVSTQAINSIFNYNKIIQYRDIIISLMNVSVCPYCNMNYILNYKETSGDLKKATADLDHFYPKAKYPEYSLCLFNFVPSCTICNSRLKRNADTNIENFIYPHTESFHGDVRFNLINLIDIQLDKEGKHEYELVLENSQKCSKTSNNIKLFNIEERYKGIHLVVERLVDKANRYNDAALQELDDILQTSSDKEDRLQELKELVFGKKLKDEEILQVSLGKFTNDILHQLGIFRD